MEPRIFISYRAIDGSKDAHRLASDLNRVFGADLVFFDKEDLVAGSSWLEMLLAAIGRRPIVLALITPEYLSPRRLSNPLDPVRQELVAALDSNALIIPLLVDGTTMKGGAGASDVAVRLKSIHGLPLRSTEWQTDVGRLVASIHSHGISRSASSFEGFTNKIVSGIKGLFISTVVLIGGCVASVVLIGSCTPKSTPPDLTGAWKGNTGWHVTIGRSSEPKAPSDQYVAFGNFTAKAGERTLKCELSGTSSYKMKCRSFEGEQQRNMFLCEKMILSEPQLKGTCENLATGSSFNLVLGRAVTAAAPAASSAQPPVP